jgi:hypothetical protein
VEAERDERVVIMSCGCRASVPWWALEPVCDVTAEQAQQSERRVKGMTVRVGEQHFQNRHRVIDKLRVTREQGLVVAVTQTDVWALLEEVDRLQLVAQAATNLEAFALHGLEEPKNVLGDALRAWKA